MIEKVLEWKEQLVEDLVKYQEMDFWQDNTGTSASIIAAKKSDKNNGVQ
mgnify:CR=1 FL=1